MAAAKKSPSTAMVPAPNTSAPDMATTESTASALTDQRIGGLSDPARLFNASLERNARRTIEINKGVTLLADAFRALIRAAVELNAPDCSKARKGRAPGHTGSAA